MERPPIRYTKTIDGLHIAYQVVGSGPFDLLPDSRTVIFPHVGHSVGIGGCVDQIMADFVDRRTTQGLDTTLCDGAVVVPPFELTD